MPPPPRVPTLTDGTVTLRAHRPGDVPAMVEQCRDPLMQQWTTVPARYQRRHAEEFLAGREPAWTSGEELTLGVDTEDGYAGTLDLRPDGAGGAEIGFALHPRARGRGVMSRAVRLYLAWGFRALDLQVVHWRAHVGNWPSRRVAWATGFRVEGTVRDLLVQRGARRDAWVGSLRRGEPMAPAHPWYSPPTLRAAAHTLRAHRETDADRIAQACNDPQTQRWLTDLPTPYTAGDAAAHLEMIRAEEASGSSMYWAVEDGAGDMVAELGLFGLRGGTSTSGELGYWAHPAARGRGATTEAVRAACRYAAIPREEGGLGLTRLLIRASADNVASRRVAEKAGFRPAGVDRAAGVMRDGTCGDDLRFDLLADEVIDDPPDRPGAEVTDGGGRAAGEGRDHPGTPATSGRAAPVRGRRPATARARSRR
jgi:ribosomal-protein-alanine N-acetyltransferase